MNEASSHSDVCSFQLSCNNAITFLFDLGRLKTFILITVRYLGKFVAVNLFLLDLQGFKVRK